MSRHARIAAAICMCFVIAFCAVWTYGNLRLLSYQIGDQRLRVGASDVQLEQSINQAVAGYKLQITNHEGSTKSYSLADTGLTLDEKATVKSLRHGPKLNPLVWWKPIPAQLVLKVDQTKLANFIADKATVITAEPTNASIKISNGKVTITKEKQGTEYGLSDAANTLQKHIGTLDKQALAMVEIPANPAITDADTAAAAAKIKSITKEKITIKIGNKTVTPTSKDISKWLGVKTDTKTNKINVVVSTGAINNYFTNLAYANSQVHRDKVIVTLANGLTSVASDGEDGMYVTNQAPAEYAVKKNLQNGKNFAVKLDANLIPYNTVTAADWPKWIEVNVTTQREYVYQNGKTIRTFLITSGKPSTPSPIGTFYIWEKVQLQTMIGADYVQPDVPWISYFDHRGDAIHGNYWRPPSVFGNVATSHGCVGMTVSDALWVYNWAPIGTPVVIHF
ncbi:MAG TPA: L,D-transpeptidase family protein [Candidatus Saccharimonadales bacterium]|nr:L,D-transpeptidase family protein [Candidatus Saccharimonadales bacterium]